MTLLRGAHVPKASEEVKKALDRETSKKPTDPQLRRVELYTGQA